MTAIIDTSFLVALTNPNERHHLACAAVARGLTERLILPHVILPEVTYLLDKYQGHQVMRAFVDRLRATGWTLEPLQPVDLERAAGLLRQYADLRLDFSDACLVAIAERLNARRVLTLDRRRFSVVRPSHCPALEILPQP